MKPMPFPQHEDSTPPVHIACAQVYGGNSNADCQLALGGLEVRVFSRAHSGEAGGDICYVGTCSEETVSRVLIADVVGHGTAVSAIGQHIHSEFRRFMDYGDNVLVLEASNAALRSLGYSALTSAAAFAYVRSEGRCYISSAGHPDCYLLKSGTGTWRPLPVSGEGFANLPLGAASETRYTQRTVDVSSGDRFFIFTDGLLEANSPEGEQFGASRLLAILNSISGLPNNQAKTRLLNSLDAHVCGVPLADDVTFALVDIV